MFNSQVCLEDEPKKFDPSFKGPIANRSCTDIICCLIFFVAILGYFVVGIIAWTHGDPRKVIYPTDSRGEFCGQVGSQNEHKPFLFYFNILKCASPLVLLEFQCPTTQTCVSKCPERFDSFITTHAQLKVKPERWKYYTQFCKPGFNDSTKTPVQVFKDGDCPAFITPNKPFTRRCFPDLKIEKGVVKIGNKTTFSGEDGGSVNVTSLLEGAKGANIVLDAREVAMKIFEDYTKSWYWILIGMIIALVVSLLFVILLRFIAAFMIWLNILLVIAVLGYGIYHCYMEYAKLKGVSGSEVTITDLGFQTDLRVYLHLRQTWLAFLIILAIMEVIIILMLIFLRKRILIAIALLKEASRAVGCIMSTLVYPIITFMLLLLCVAYWGVTAVFLSTSSEPVYKVFANENTCNYSMKTCNPKTFNVSNIIKQCPEAQCLFAFYGGESYYHRYLILFQFYNVFLFFWLTNFVIALGQVTLAGAFASYYWAFNKPADVPACPVFSSMGRALRYHTGSLAFGSLLLAIVQVIRVILEYIDQKVKGAKNKLAQFILSCLKCCFWCLEKFLKFLNRNAYIMVAIYGKNFCTSARNAFFLLMRNIIRVVVLDKVTDFLLFLGKMLIVGGVGVLGFFFFTNQIIIIEDKAPTLNYYWVPLLTLIVGSYLVAHGFFSVYAMCVDTLFLCFCEDLERNDGSAERPYYTSLELRHILYKKEYDSPQTPQMQEE
ncbi:choline transporter-like protein 2 isoform X2 [Carcharodon carcharias]|uniref:choline transporter-like protein 2 isoform X2 n=1 Tax=Carcharodon carcharias TaxID=13397 RepID=UPI001B7DE9A4|nr:choline transporter-like protein 2 isoform X2 [Carcharodon carcharias]